MKGTAAMWQYDKRYLTKLCVLAGVICFSVSMLMFIFGLIIHAERDDMLIGVGGWLLIFVLCVVYGLIRVWLEHRLARRQTRDFGLSFLFEEAKPLYPSSLHFLGANVLIWAGRLALHRSFISEMLLKPGNKFNDTGGWYCHCRCLDGKTRRIFAADREDAESLLEWWTGTTGQRKSSTREK